MSHLTTKDLIRILDGTIADGEQTRLMLHLESCDRCKNELSFQRSLERAVRNAPLDHPSRNFTANVLGRVAPQKRKSIVSKVVDNLGNILAMMLVLTAVWYALSSPAVIDKTQQPSIFSSALATYVEYYAAARDFVSKESTAIAGAPRKDQGSMSDTVVTLMAISFVALLIIDRFIVRRLVRTKA